MKNILIKGLYLLTFIWAGFAIAQTTWTESSYQDFIDGTFDDAGANMYVSQQGPDRCD